MNKNNPYLTAPTGTSQCHLTRDIGPSIRVCQLNIEGISRAKCEHLSKILIENKIDVVLLQETHTENDIQLSQRGKIAGYTAIGTNHHKHYGLATYVRSNISNATLLSVDTEFEIYSVSISIADIKIINIYKPPNANWPRNTLPIHAHPAVYCGDFNSHHSNWRYATCDQNGLQLMEWADINLLHLLFDAKDRSTFWSARWSRGYNPDLCFVTSDNNNTPLHSSRRVLQDFPHSQHRPVLIEVGIKIPLVNTVPKSRWNFNKAKWSSFATQLDANVRWIPPLAKNYDRFASVVISTAKKHIPRGHRKEYIPGWNRQSDQLYKEFLESGDNNIATELLNSLDISRAQKWKSATENLDFTHASTKAWNLLRKLGGSNSILQTRPKIRADLIANSIVDVSRAKSDKSHTRKVRKDLKTLKATSHPSPELTLPFSLSELEAAIKSTKNGKSAGVDGIYPEFLKNCGPNTKSWLIHFFSDILESGYIPRTFKRTKTIALLKPGKPSDKAESYRPIALLSVCYKVLERMLYNRIEPIINQYIPIEQAGFRSGRSCTDQILALTTFIESGFQKKLKTSTVFIDLTAAYDTVWREGLVYKLLKTLKCSKTSSLINNMLTNRIFQVFLNDDCSKARKLSNGLPQGSVLSPLLFNLYVSDLPDTTSRKFGYADDLSLATQSHDMSITEDTLTADLTLLSQYLKKMET